MNLNIEPVRIEAILSFECIVVGDWMSPGNELASDDLHVRHIDCDAALRALG